MNARLPDDLWPVLDGGVNHDLLDVDWMRDTLLPALRAALAAAKAEGAREALESAADELHALWIDGAPGVAGIEGAVRWLRARAAGVATAPTEPAARPLVPVAQPAEPTCHNSGHKFSHCDCESAAPSPGADPAATHEYQAPMWSEGDTEMYHVTACAKFFVGATSWGDHFCGREPNDPIHVAGAGPQTTPTDGGPADG